jgi:hypothetical protein
LSTGGLLSVAPEHREEWINCIEQLCRNKELFIISDSSGPVTFARYEPSSREIIWILTRNGKEKQGYGTSMLCELAKLDPFVKVRPVTRFGKILASKCGFSPMDEDESTWIRSNLGACLNNSY